MNNRRHGVDGSEGKMKFLMTVKGLRDFIKNAKYMTREEAIDMIRHISKYEKEYGVSLDPFASQPSKESQWFEYLAAQREGRLPKCTPEECMDFVEHEGAYMSKYGSSGGPAASVQPRAPGRPPTKRPAEATASSAPPRTAVKRPRFQAPP
eukprot:m.213022 g.213022  ORF g.213022 m.213022 type:complete len:151 (-) comp26343_c0_seq1:696-1148(-)